MSNIFNQQLGTALTNVGSVLQSSELDENNTVQSAKLGLYHAHGLTSKTEKTLTKLSRWEEKIHNLLLKTSPETAAKLFAPGTPTFATLLQKLKQGEAVEQSYHQDYDAYRDKLNNGIKYIATQKEQLDSNYIKKAKLAYAKAKELDTTVANSEATAKFIKERKKQMKEKKKTTKKSLL